MKKNGRERETMKKLASILLAILMLALLSSAAMAKEGTIAGEGTQSNPYLIEDLADLKAFRDAVNGGNNYSKKFVQLNADINLNGEEWTPIGNSDAPFNGTFDGGNHTISNLVITGYKNYVGLFGRTNNGEVKNLTIKNAKVSGRLGVGVVAGTPYTSKYTNIKVTGHVEVNGMAYVGGVGGRNAYANWTDIEVNVDSTSYVKANSVEDGTAYRTYVGGVIGFMGEGGHEFKNISSNIDVIGSTIDVGGITGIAHYNNTFRNITCSGDVTLTDAGEYADALEVGGIAAVWHNESGTKVTFENVKYTGKISATYTDSNGDKKTLTNADYDDGGVIGAPYSSTGAGKLVREVAEVKGVKYFSLKDAANAAGNGDKITLIAAIKDAGTVSLPADVTFDGNGMTISGDSALYVNPKGACIFGVNFKNISNSKGKLSAIYANGLTGELEVTDCSFNDVDWDAIQVTPEARSDIRIIENTFVAGAGQKRFVHIQSEKNTDFSAIVIKNVMEGKTAEGALNCYYFTNDDPKVIDLTGNTISDPANSCVLMGNGENRNDLLFPITDDFTAAIIKGEYDMRMFASIQAALDAADADEEVVRVDSSAEIPYGYYVDKQEIVRKYPTHTLTVKKMEGATIVIKASNGKVMSANSDGTYSLMDATYEYVVSKAGYEDEKGSFSIINAPYTLDVTAMYMTPAIPPQIDNKLESATYVKDAAAAALTVMASTPDNGTLSYQWFVSDIEMPGEGEKIKDETNPTFTPPTDEIGTKYYYCVATNTIEIDGNIMSSNNVTNSAKIVVTEVPAGEHVANIIVNGREHTSYVKVTAYMVELGNDKPLYEHELQMVPTEGNFMKFSYSQVAKDGKYNVVVTATLADGKNTQVTTTTLADLEGHDDTHEVNLPDDKRSSTIEDSTNIGIIAGGVDEVAEKVDTMSKELGVEISKGEHVEVELKIEKIEKNAEAKEEAAEISEQAAQDGKKVEMTINIDLLLKKLDANNKPVGAAHDLGNVNKTMLTILIPFDLGGRIPENFVMYRMHNGKLEVIPQAPASDKPATTECFEVYEDHIELNAYQFSTYTLAYGENVVVDLPQTGDNTNMALWLAMLGMSMIALCGAAMKRRIN